MTTIEPKDDLAARELERVLHHDIPLTRDMGMRVIDWHTHTLRLHLPLAPNVNHKSTLFGGSLYCGAVLAGWGRCAATRLPGAKRRRWRSGKNSSPPTNAEAARA